MFLTCESHKLAIVCLTLENTVLNKSRQAQAATGTMAFIQNVQNKGVHPVSVWIDACQGLGRVGGNGERWSFFLG